MQGFYRGITKMNEILITPFGDQLLYGCDHKLCRYCKLDPYPADCHAHITASPKGRRIKEIRDYCVLD